MILPVIDKATDGSSSLGLRIIAFVCVLLDPIDTSGSADWTGVLTSGCVTGGGRDGPTLPPTASPRLTLPSSFSNGSAAVRRAQDGWAL